MPNGPPTQQRLTARLVLIESYSHTIVVIETRGWTDKELVAQYGLAGEGKVVRKHPIPWHNALTLFPIDKALVVE